jgi:hypothetical protein
LAAGKALSNVPGVGTALNAVGNKLVPGYTTAKNVAQGLSGAAQAYANNAAASTTNTMMETYKGLQHTASQYVKSGQQVPQGLIDTLKDIESKIVAQHGGAVNPATAPGTAPQPAQAAPRPMPQAGPAQAAGAVAPEAEAAAQAAAKVAPNAINSGFAQELGTLAKPTAAEGATLLSRMAPYLQTIGKFAAPIARVAGPAGMALTAAEAYPYLQQANIGERTKSGEVKALMNSANRMALNSRTAAPLSPTEAKNLLDSGDERTIKIYGGRDRLKSIIAKQGK